MKHTVAALTAICSIVCLACAPRAEATGGRSLRADLPCPYGGGGAPNADAWSPGTPSSSINPNPGLLLANSATLIAGSNITGNTDDNGLPLSSTGQTVQYDWYTSPIPNVSTCSPDPFANGNSPVEQVIQYTLAATSVGAQSVAAGDTEIEFNYDASLAGATGVASFTIGGVTYSSIGPVLPTDTLNDFLFDQSGHLLGALGLDASFNATFTSGIPTGWTSSGGTVSAPEIDPASATAGLTLLLGGLAVLRGGRRARPIPTIG